MQFSTLAREQEVIKLHLSRLVVKLSWVAEQWAFLSLEKHIFLQLGEATRRQRDIRKDVLNDKSYRDRKSHVCVAKTA